MHETTIETGAWALLRVGYKRQDTGTKAHRVDGDRTVCGFKLDGRAVPAPRGARRCVICAIGEAV